MKKIRVVRVLEFVGPDYWIEQTLKNSWLQPGVDPEYLITGKAKEICRIKEELP